MFFERIPSSRQRNTCTGVQGLRTHAVVASRKRGSLRSHTDCVRGGMKTAARGSARHAMRVCAMGFGFVASALVTVLVGACIEKKSSPAAQLPNPLTISDEAEVEPRPSVELTTAPFRVRLATGMPASDAPPRTAAPRPPARGSYMK